MLAVVRLHTSRASLACGWADWLPSRLLTRQLTASWNLLLPRLQPCEHLHQCHWAAQLHLLVGAAVVHFAASAQLCCAVALGVAALCLCQHFLRLPGCCALLQLRAIHPPSAPNPLCCSDPGYNTRGLTGQSVCQPARTASGLRAAPNNATQRGLL